MSHTSTVTCGPKAVNTLLVSQGDGNHLITNLSLTTTLYIGEDNAFKAADTDVNIPVPPNGSVVVDGSSDIYGTATANILVAILYGGVASFLGLTQSQGILVLPSIQSSNYVPGVSGWAIFSNGLAEFNGVIARGNIVFSDGWLSNGDGTYTNTPGLFLYSGTPAAGNLIYSNTNATGSDKFSNNYLAGDSTYDNTAKLATSRISGMENFYTFNNQPNAAFVLNGIIQTAVDFTSGLAGPGIQAGYEFQITNGTGNTIQILPDGNSHANLINNLDQQSYGFGQLLRIVGNNTLINSTTPINLMTVTALSPGYYSVRGRIRFTSAASGTIQPMNIRFLGNLTCDNIDICTLLEQEGANVGTFNGFIGAQNTDPSVTANLANGTTYRWEFDGIIHATAQGSWVLAARQGTSSLSETFTVLDHSWMEVKAY